MFSSFCSNSPMPGEHFREVSRLAGYLGLVGGCGGMASAPMQPRSHPPSHLPSVQDFPPPQALLWLRIPLVHKTSCALQHVSSFLTLVVISYSAHELPTGRTMAFPSYSHLTVVYSKWRAYYVWDTGLCAGDTMVIGKDIDLCHGWTWMQVWC